MKLILLMSIASLLTYCVMDDLSITPIPFSPISPLQVQVEQQRTPVVVTNIRPDWSLTHDDGVEVKIWCHLRRGGSEGVVRNQEIFLNYGMATTISWDIEDLEPRWYEVFCLASRRGYLLRGLFNIQSMDCAEGCGFEFVEHWEVE